MKKFLFCSVSNCGNGGDNLLQNKFTTTLKLLDTKGRKNYTSTVRFGATPVPTVTGISPLLLTDILLKFLGYILPMNKDEPANIYALYEPSHGRRPPGRTRRSFLHQVHEWIDPNNYLLEDIMHRHCVYCPRPSQLEVPYSRLFLSAER